MTKQYVYQLSVRKPDDDLKKIRIETDTIFTEKELTKEAIEKISTENKVDVILQFVGFLVPSKKEIPLQKVEYYTDDDLDLKIKSWKEQTEA
jgi:hypothetical protein